VRTLTLQQGSPEWLAHRRTTRNASDAPAMMDNDGPEIVDAMGVVGVVMGEKHAVDPVDFSGKKLLTQVRREQEQTRRLLDSGNMRVRVTNLHEIQSETARAGD
jgi:hypothetical protein